MQDFVELLNKAGNIGTAPLLVYLIWRMDRRIAVLESIVEFIRKGAMK